MPSHSAFTSQLLRLQWQLAAYDLQRKLARFTRLVKGGYNPDQPRVPAGSPEGGQWTSEGGVSGSGAASAKPQGHHYVSRSVYKKLPLRPETRSVFDRATTGKLNAGHGYDAQHKAYNDAVEKQLQKFLSEKDIVPAEMTPAQAREFVDVIKHSTDPRIRTFNYRIIMREIRYLFLRMPRDFD